MGKQLKWKAPDSDPIVEEEEVEQTPTAWKAPESDPVEDEPVKKNGAPNLPTSSVSPEPGKPSEKNGKKPTSFVETLTQAFDELVQAYKTPASAPEPVKEGEPAKPTPKKIDFLSNAWARGTALAKSADVMGPMEGKPTPEQIQQVAEAQKQSKSLPSSESYKKVTEAPSFGAAVKEFAKDPIMVLAEVTAESMSSMAQYGATRIAAGAAIGAAGGSVVAPGPGTLAGLGGGAIVGMGQTSLGLEFAGSVLESFEAAGVDVTDPKQLTAAFEDEAIVSKARAHAFKKSIPIALFDLVSGGIAGKLVAKPAKSLVGKTAQGTYELLVQAGLGAGGEATGQAVAGEKFSPGGILMEALGEGVSTPVEATTGVLTHNRPEQIATPPGVLPFKTPEQVVTQQTQNVPTTNEPAVAQKSEAIQQAVDQNEAAVSAGMTNVAQPPISNYAPQPMGMAKPPTMATTPATVEETTTTPDQGTTEEATVPEAEKEDIGTVSPESPHYERTTDQSVIEALKQPEPPSQKAQITVLTEEGGQKLYEIKQKLSTGDITKEAARDEINRLVENGHAEYVQQATEQPTTQEPAPKKELSTTPEFTVSKKPEHGLGILADVPKENQVKTNQGAFKPVHFIFDDDQAALFNEGVRPKKGEPPNERAKEFVAKVREAAKKNRKYDAEIVLDFRKPKTEEQNAIPEQSTTEVDVRQQAGDGGTLAEGNAGIETTTGEGQPTVEGTAQAEAETPNVQPKAEVSTTEVQSTPERSKEETAEHEKAVKLQAVHELAAQRGVDIESKEFRKASEDVTTKGHLDDMTPGELDLMLSYIENAYPPPPPPTGSVVLDASEEDQLSGIKKALVPEEKVKTTPIEKRTFESTLAEAQGKIASGELNPKAIVDEIINEKARPLASDEVAALVYYKTQLDNKAAQLNSKMVDAINNNDVAAQANLRPQIEAINQEIDNYHEMALRTAYEQSLAFNMRKLLLDSEYNLASQITAYKAINNGKIPKDVEDKFKQLDEELKAANAKIARLEEQQSKGQSEEAMAAVRQDLQRQRESRKKSAQARKDKINDFFNGLKAKPDKNKFNSITQVIGEVVYNGAIDAIRLAVLAGSDAATAIQAGVDYINEHYRGNDFKEKQFRDMVTPGVEKLVPPTKEKKKAEVNEDGKLVIPAAMIRELVEEQGITKIEDLVSAVKELIENDIPGVTDREIRDAITRYGQTRTQSKDEISTQIREMKRVGRLLSALEDVQNKKRPLRSGLQRDKLTDEERRLQREVKEEMKNLPVDPEEEAKSWKNALDAVKARLTNQIKDIQHQIDTGEKAPAKKKGIIYDEEATALKAQRDHLKNILESLEGKPKMSDEQRIRNAVSAVERSIADLEDRIANKKTDAKQRNVTPETPELKRLREQREELRKQYEQMEKDLGVADKKRLEAGKAAVKRSIENLENRIKNKDFTTAKKPPLKEDAELTRLKLEREKIKQEFDKEKEKARLANRPWHEKVWDTFNDLWNVPKALQATLDMSGPFRQGFILTVSHPASGLKAFKEMFWQAWSEKRAEEWMLQLKDSPLYPVIKQSKLYVSEPNAKLTAKEEQFLSNFAKKIPILGDSFEVGRFKVPGLGLISKSERAYSGYLNKLRVDVFANGMDRLREQTITPENNPEAYKAWADFINNATGRGNLGKLELAAPVLNGLFFSPRYLASRLNLLNPVKYAKMPGPVRKMALKSVIAYAGFVSLFVGLIAASSDDWEVEWDPRSSDFGKLKFGNTRYDLLAGFSQVIRFLTQFTIAQKKNTTDGQIVELNGKKFPFDNRMTVLGNFLRSKLAPVPGSFWNLATGKNMVGEEVTPGGELLRGVLPLYVQDVSEIIQEEGPTGVVMTAIPAFFGIGVQSYKPKEKKGKPGKKSVPKRSALPRAVKRDVEE